MANYIDQELLCEAYTHFNIEEYPSEATRAQLKTELKHFFEERAKFLFGEEISIEIEFEEGSLKTKLKVIGKKSILGAVALVTAYGSIRAGIDSIARDSTMLAQSGILEIAFRSKTAFCDQVAVERRKGVFGRASEFMTQLDGIRDVLNTSTIPDKQEALNTFNRRINDLITWDQRIDSLFAKLENSSTKGCIAAGLLEELAKLSDEAPWLEELEGKSFRSRTLRADAELYAKLKGSAAAMQGVVAIAKKKMVERVMQAEPKNA